MMNTSIIFKVKNRRISSDTKSIDLIGDNMDYTAVFDLDEDMESERIKTARFIKDDEQQERILDDNNSCQIPPELLKKGYISVGLYTDEKSTTPCFLQINGSIREKDYSVKDPEPDVYRQLLEKIEKLKGLREIELRADEKNIQWRYVGEDEWKELISFSDIAVSPEEIKQAIKEYLKENPLKETDPTVPDWAKEPQKPTYTAEEVGALPADTNIPTKTSELENDSGYLTEHQDISGKLDSPPTPEVGKILKVKSVNEDGTFVCEWADGGSDLDVRIDGQSIVQDGVAEIPIAKKPGMIGLFKLGDYALSPLVWTTYGGSKGWYLKQPTKDDWDWHGSRYSMSNQIAVSVCGFDDALRRGMTDGIGAAWTVDEQASARKRMGINDLTLIANYTTDIDVVSLRSELNECSEIFVYAYANFNAEKSGEYLYFSINGKSVVVGQNMRFGNTYRNYYMHAILLPSGFLSVHIGYGLQNFGLYTYAGMAPFKYLSSETLETFGETINSVELASVNPAKVICSGSRFMVFGR